MIFLLLFVARSKLVPDFALTIHFLHLLIVTFYTRAIPSRLFWWGLQAASAALMTSLGMWACQWRELKPLAFGGNRTTDSTAAAGPAESAAGDAAGGFPVGGSSRGSGRDGGGVYEMIGMGPKDDPV